MSKLKIVFTVMALGGVAGLTALGIGDPGHVVEIGIGIGTFVAAVFAIFKKT